MPYVPPPPGSTTPGAPTPDGVEKQSVHITDLPPEVRKNFLTSMVYFPTLVGAMVCVIMFLGWWIVFKPTVPSQYATRLTSDDPRLRWTAARELSENIGNERIYDAATLEALVKVLQNKDLDSENEAWSPTTMIKGEDERATKLRWWAATMTGHVGGVLMQKGQKDQGELAFKALEKALEEKDLAVYAARGLSLLKDLRAREALVKLLNDPEQKDAGIKAAAANALGAVGSAALNQKVSEAELEAFREPLRKAFAQAAAAKEVDVQDNCAIALARLNDPTGKERLQELTRSADSVVRDNAQRALALLK